jgi:NADH-quinone oxidoreductase subunit C
MPLAPAITDLEQLKERPPLARLLAWDPSAVETAKFDRDELSIVIRRSSLRESCAILREPRFEVVYHLLSISRHDRVRLKVRLAGDDPSLESITSVWPSANFFEREVYDLFGVRFSGHPNLRRIMMPEDWEGYPLRKDYPVEGFR